MFSVGELSNVVATSPSTLNERTPVRNLSSARSVGKDLLLYRICHRTEKNIMNPINEALMKEVLFSFLNID